MRLARALSVSRQPVNDSQQKLVYPAAYSNVIGVGSVNQQNQLSSFSNSGSDIVPRRAKR